MEKIWKTRQVMVGNVGVGADNPVRIQSMTTSNTRDPLATIEQIMRLSDAGCDIVRVTVQGIKEADACSLIKNGLIRKGYTIPIVADIHFYPPAALRVVDFVEKVRINPGNFVDKRANFKVIEYDDLSYATEIEKIEEKFTPLVEKCKNLNRSMRIGTNHGSLSDRIMNRYGDTPEGMVESALEFARICIKNDFHNFIFSMKSSNPQVMVLAYRLLVDAQMKLGWDYPLHLGVTEAGEGEDGRIKSAMGIGSLLLDGIGDTIRVSLTEDPWHEIDPCERLVDFASDYKGKRGLPYLEGKGRRSIILPRNLSMHRDGTVIVSADKNDLKNKEEFYKNIGLDVRLGSLKLKVSTADNVAVKESHPLLKPIQEIGVGLFSTNPIDGAVSVLSLKEALIEQKMHAQVERFQVTMPTTRKLAVRITSSWEGLDQIKPSCILLSPETNRIEFSRQFFKYLEAQGSQVPVILNFKYDVDKEDLIIQAAAECGSLLCDGMGEGLWLEADYDIDFMRTLSFNILQAARMRTSKTDFISCPSCGRTLFDLQDVTKRIRGRTAHLPGVKIAIMGCIVNGPGEMADADFGYVGSKPGKIDLYVGRECVERDIDFADADDRLINLIKSHGRWLEPESAEVVVTI